MSTNDGVGIKPDRQQRFERISLNTEEKFWSKVKKTKSCWLWTGTKTHNGYGQFYSKINGNLFYRSHRFSFWLHRGFLDKKLTIDHLCRKRLCVNPSHLEQVSNRTNVLRGNGIPAKNYRKKNCKWGHPFSAPNLYMDQGFRRCRTCSRRKAKDRRFKQKIVGAAHIQGAVNGGKRREERSSSITANKERGRG